MWMIIGLIIVAIVIKFAADMSKQNNKVAKQGGMENKYRILISHLINGNDRSEIVERRANSLTLKFISDGAVNAFFLSQTFEKITVQWKMRSHLFGEHKLEWKFPEYGDQENMAKRIINDSGKYLENVMLSFGIDDDQKPMKIINHEEESSRFKVLNLNQLFNNTLRIMQDAVLPQMEDDSFEYMDDLEKGIAFKQRFDIMLAIFSLVHFILDENEQLKQKFEKRFERLKNDIITQQSKNNYLKEYINLELDSFFYCLVDRINLYKYELKDLIEAKYVNEYVSAPLYFFLFDPGNVLSTYDYSESEKYALEEVLEDMGDQRNLDVIGYVHALKDSYKFLLNELK